MLYVCQLFKFRQHSPNIALPSSCFIFTLYVDGPINLMKGYCRLDGFLTWLPVLIGWYFLATSRERCIAKLDILFQFCNSSGMVINETKIIVVDIDTGDKVTLELIFAGEIYMGLIVWLLHLLVLAFLLPMVLYGMRWRLMARISISTVWSLCHSLVRTVISSSPSSERCCCRHWCRFSMAVNPG